MIRYLLILLSLVSFAAAETTVSTGYVSTYMWRGQKLANQAAQSSVDYTKDALDVGVWNSTPLKSSDGEREFDIYGSYSFDVLFFSIQPGFTAYYYPQAKTNEGLYRTTFEPNLGLNLSLGDFKLAPKAYYDLTLHGLTYELGSTYSLPLKRIKSELDLSAAAGTYRLTNAVNGDQTRAWGDYWSVGIAAPFNVGRGKLTVGWSYVEGGSAFFKTRALPKEFNDTAVGRQVVSASYSISL